MMRVFGSAKWILGLAASGSAMFVMGGQAWAADSATIDPGLTSVTAAQYQSQSQTTVSSTDSANVSVVVSDTNGSAAKTAAVPSETAAAAAAPSVVPPVAVQPSGLAAADKPAVPSANLATVPAPVEAAKPVPAAEPVTKKPAAVTYVPVNLPVQPVITSASTVFKNDLAATLPTALPASAPAANNSPVPPAVPTSALGQLSAQLAGSVVRPAFVPSAAPIAPAVLFALMIAVMLLVTCNLQALGVFASRRDGFAHAARSDVAAATLNFLFATPFSLSYVTDARQHVTHF